MHDANPYTVIVADHEDGAPRWEEGCDTPWSVAALAMSNTRPGEGVTITGPWNGSIVVRRSLPNGPGAADTIRWKAEGVRTTAKPDCGAVAFAEMLDRMQALTVTPGPRVDQLRLVVKINPFVEGRVYYSIDEYWTDGSKTEGPKFKTATEALIWTDREYPTIVVRT